MSNQKQQLSLDHIEEAKKIVIEGNRAVEVQDESGVTITQTFTPLDQLSAEQRKNLLKHLTLPDQLSPQEEQELKNILGIQHQD